MKADPKFSTVDLPRDLAHHLALPEIAEVQYLYSCSKQYMESLTSIVVLA